MNRRRAYGVIVQRGGFGSYGDEIWKVGGGVLSRFLQDRGEPLQSPKALPYANSKLLSPKMGF